MGKEYPHIEIIEFGEEGENMDSIIEPYFTTPIRKYAYHCALFGDKYCTADAPNYTESSGLSSYEWGQVLFIAMGCAGSNTILTTEQTAGTYMHELGHNFGLHHGGDDEYNYKPNYLSVMNYAFQFDGLYGTGKYDYSHYLLPSLYEGNLIESDGFDKDGLTKGTGLGTKTRLPNGNFESIAERPCDFNGNGEIDASAIILDLNDDDEFSKLNSFHDWNALEFHCGSIGTRINSNTPSGFTIQSVDS